MSASSARPATFASSVTAPLSTRERIRRLWPRGRDAPGHAGRDRSRSRRRTTASAAIFEVSNPHRNEPAAFTTSTYDALGRIRQVPTSRRRARRSRCTPESRRRRSRIQWGHARLSRTDALGRVRDQVFEDPDQEERADRLRIRRPLDNLLKRHFRVSRDNSERSKYDAPFASHGRQTNPRERPHPNTRYDAGGNLSAARGCARSA